MKILKYKYMRARAQMKACRSSAVFQVIVDETYQSILAEVLDSAGINRRKTLIEAITLQPSLTTEQLEANDIACESPPCMKFPSVAVS